MRFAHVSIKCFQIERQFSEILRFEATHFQFDCDQTVETTMEKQQVDRKIPVTHLQRKFRAHKTEVAAEFNQEFSEPSQKSAMKIGLGM